MATIKVCQMNARHAQRVTPEIRQKAFEKGIDVIMLQEPYHQNKKITGFGINTKLAYKKDKEPYAAIVVLDASLSIVQITDICNSHFVVIEVNKSGQQIYVVSGYCQRKDEIEKHLEALNEILVILEGKKVLIGLDSNACSPLWGPQRTDNKGEKLEDFITEHDS